MGPRKADDPPFDSPSISKDIFYDRRRSARTCSNLRTKSTLLLLLDTKRWDAWAELFTEDMILDNSESDGPPPIRGRDEPVTLVRATIKTARTARQVHSLEIQIERDIARRTWATQDRVVIEDGTSPNGYGHYTERYVRHDNRWRIAASKVMRLHADCIAPMQP